MKNYLSFGGGVNSVAMMLYCLDEGWDFEAVFVNHGTDWPETYEYFNMFQGWLKKRGYKPITELKPNVQGYSNLYNYFYDKKTIPFRMTRDCSHKFKSRTLKKYQQTPCFVCIGFDLRESHRAKISTEKGIEYRWPLIEAEMNRWDCKDYIKKHGLSTPIKSGCFICPFQNQYQTKDMRMNKPELYCKAQKIEKQFIAERKKKGLRPGYLYGSNYGTPIDVFVEEDQRRVFKQDEYPPCECFL